MSTRFAEFVGAEWGPAVIEPVDLELLSEFTGLDAEQCLRRLRDYRPELMADEWRARGPSTPEEIRAFYSRTDNYLWELFCWNGSEQWEPYRRRLERLAALRPPDRHPRALDFGSGIGTAALLLARRGYRVTLADLQGRTLDFARARLKRHGFTPEVVEIVNEVPALPREHWDICVSFDVFEHVPNPGEIARAVVGALSRGGGAAIVATFDEPQDLYPHHLPAVAERYRDHRWHLYLQSLGMKEVGDHLYVRTGVSGSIVRRLRYEVWRRTGVALVRLPR